MRWATTALAASAALLAGCKTVASFREDRIAPKGGPVAVSKDCGAAGAVGCPPVDRRQYYDDRTARYYYFDLSTGRYYWENGEPRF